MGNCISCQSHSAPEKHWATNGGRNAPMTRKAAMERYPVPTRCRVPSTANEPILTCESSSVSGAVTHSDSGDSSNFSSASGLRSKLRLPTTGIHLPRPQSIPLNKVTDSNGNIPRLSNLPRFKGSSFDSTTPLKCQLSSSNYLKGNIRTTIPNAVAERVNPDVSQLKSVPSVNHEACDGRQSIPTAGGKQPFAPEAAPGSRSPTLSSVSSSTVRSNRSNHSNSLEDSGIASATMSPAVSEKKSAMSLRFGFQSRKKIPSETKTTPDGVIVLNQQPTKEQFQQTAGSAQTPLKVLNQNALKDANLSGQQQATPKYGTYTIKDRINMMRGFSSSSHLLKMPTYSSHSATINNGANAAVATPPSIPTAGNSGHKLSRKLQKGSPRPSQAHSVKLIDGPDGVMSSLALVKNRAALVLKQSSPAPNKPAEPKPKLSIEAIVASLEREIRQQIGEDEKPLPVEPIEKPKEESPVQIEDVTCLINHYDLRPMEAQVMFVESPVVEFIENITPIDTPSSICTTFNSHHSPDGDDPSREDRSRGDEEDSAATSISDDAMIDDEIADQPGLVMLGQSASVPSSPTRSWRSNLYDCHVPAMSLASCHSLQSEEEELDGTSDVELLRRRVASVSGSEIGDGVRDDLVVGVKELKVKGNEDDAMRTELYSPWQETIVVDLEEYTAMANELADIKAKLVALQTLLMEIPEAENRCSNVAATPLWDLKRDIVLLREELQEKNLTIRTLKNELRASTGKTHDRMNSSSSSPTASHPKKVSCANVATQTDRPRTATFSNGLSPSNEDVQLVSFRIGQF